MSTAPSQFSRRFATAITAIGLAAATVIVAASPSTTLALPGASESTVVTVSPTRVLDSRAGTDVGLIGRFQSNTPRKLQVTGVIATYIEATDTRVNAQVVPTGATGVILNVTAFVPSAAGFVSVRPGDATGQPSTSSLNFTTGQVVPNSVTVAVPTTGPNAGQIDVTMASSPGQTMDVIIDIVAYTTATGLTDLANRVTALETLGTAGPKGDTGDKGDQGEQGVPGTDLYKRIIVVNGDLSDIDNGTALKAAVAAASVATAADPWVVQVEPGVFDLGAATIQLDVPAHVSLLGSGPRSTTIRSAVLPFIRLRERSVLADVFVDGASTTGNQLTVIEVLDSPDAAIENVDIRAFGTLTTAIGVENSDRLSILGVDSDTPGNGLRIVDSVDVSVRDSTLVSTDSPVLGMCCSGVSSVVVVDSVLNASDSGVRAAISVINGSGTATIDVRHSTVISASGPSFKPNAGDLAGPTADRFSMYQTHVDVSQPIGALGNTTAHCAVLSSPAGASANNCL